MEKDLVNQRKQNTTYHTILALKEENSTPTTAISGILASTFEQTSSNNNRSKEFQKYKLETEVKPPLLANTDSDPQSTASLNEPVSVQELMYALSRCGNTCPGPDGILIILPIILLQNTINYLLSIFNCIWNHNVFPEIWNKAIRIPIL